MKKVCLIMITILSLAALSTYGDSQSPITYTNGTQFEEKDINYVSEYTLLGSPSDYNGKKIRVVGVLKAESNKTLLYASKEDMEMGVTKNALWCNINLYNIKDADVKKLSGEYVLIEGVFSNSDSGQLNTYSGIITNIRKIQEWN